MFCCKRQTKMHNVFQQGKHKTKDVHKINYGLPELTNCNDKNKKYLASLQLFHVADV